VLQNFPNDEPACLSCHPLGFQVLHVGIGKHALLIPVRVYQVVVGFKEHIRIYNIVMDELKLFRETPVKGCRDIRFSHGGHMFAATASINVLVFCSVTFEQLFSFQGHMGPVRRVVWTHKDSMLLSIAADGNVYGWNSRTGGRVDLLTSSGRGTTLQGLAVDHKDSNALHDQLRSYSQSETSSQLTRDEMSCAVISSSDGTVRLLHWQADESSADGQEEVELELPPKVSITTLHLSLSTTYVHSICAYCYEHCVHRLLYTGQSDGNIRVYSWPLTSNAPYVEYSAHTGSVTCLAETIDGKALLSCGEDGSVFIFAIFIEQVGVSAGVSLSFNLQTSLSIADIMLAENYNADVMFVSREEIEEHVNETIELNKQITSMKSKHEFDLHQRDSELADEVRKLTEQRDAQVTKSTVEISMPR
jgi:WD40 repeat protein